MTSHVSLQFRVQFPVVILSEENHDSEMSNACNYTNKKHSSQKIKTRIYTHDQSVLSIYFAYQERRENRCFFSFIPRIESASSSSIIQEHWRKGSLFLSSCQTKEPLLRFFSRPRQTKHLLLYFVFRSWLAHFSFQNKWWTGEALVWNTIPIRMRKMLYFNTGYTLAVTLMIFT